MRRALITGVSGQDGYYLAELLVGNGYSVVGTSDHVPTSGSLPGQVDVECVDMRDADGLASLVRRTRPDEVYNLAAQSNIGLSYAEPIVTCDVTGMGALRLLEAVRRDAPSARFLQASSAEIFGDSAEERQNEHTPLRPHSPYGIAKAFAHQLMGSYRRSHAMFCCSAILFNHESPRRGDQFVTRKVTMAAARLSRGLGGPLELGNLDARRDWGFAGDYADAMHRMLQASRPDDFVVATGSTKSIRELLDAAFGYVGLRWEGHVQVAERLVRPADTRVLCGDASKAREVLGWEPRVDFKELIGQMVEADLAALATANS